MAGPILRTLDRPEHVHVCIQITKADMAPAWHRCCTFDNRGIGSSSIPESLSVYKTGIMAGDVRALMDHLDWRRAHIMGMSLGGAHFSIFDFIGTANSSIL